MKSFILRCWITLALLRCFADAIAHQASDSFLRVERDGASLRGQWEIAVRDLDLVLSLDLDQDGAITWGELSAQRQAIERYAFSKLKIDRQGVPSVVAPRAMLLRWHQDAAFAVLDFNSAPTESSIEPLSPSHTAKPLVSWAVESRLFAEIDTQHRTLLRWDNPGADPVVAALSFSQPTQQVPELGSGPSHTWAGLVWHGMEHIATGMDHILFLVALLLPGVLRRRSGRWEGSDSLKQSLMAVVRVVTAFTVAHSLTLALAAADWVRVPSRGVESVIALSVIVAALNNLHPFMPERGWSIPFGFGLIHGFGFAGPLREMGVQGWDLGKALIGFNLGVEVGQLLLVLMLVPIAYTLRHTKVYRLCTLPLGSAAIACVALVWLVERWFDVKWLPV